MEIKQKSYIDHNLNEYLHQTIKNRSSDQSNKLYCLQSIFIRAIIYILSTKG